MNQIMTKTTDYCECEMPIVCICGKTCRLCDKSVNDDTVRRYNEAYNEVAKEFWWSGNSDY